MYMKIQCVCGIQAQQCYRKDVHKITSEMAQNDMVYRKIIEEVSQSAAGNCANSLRVMMRKLLLIVSLK